MVGSCQGAGRGQRSHKSEVPPPVIAFMVVVAMPGSQGFVIDICRCVLHSLPSVSSWTPGPVSVTPQNTAQHLMHVQKM